MSDAFFLFIAFISVLLNASAHLSLKTYIEKNKVQFKPLTQKVFSLWLIVGFLLFFLCIITSIYAQKKIELKDFVVISSLSYIIVPIGSMIVFKDKIRKTQTIALMIVLLGILIFNFDIIMY
jgi:drug/metabolite transporter (DMT)-like permease